MEKADRIALVTLPVAILFSLGLAWAGSRGGFAISGFPLFALVIGMAFLIQWLAFSVAWLLRSERFFDLTGAVTYVSVMLTAALLGPVIDGRSLLLLLLVLIWAGRLGAFLVRRIRRAGRDARFDDIKVSFLRFLNAWTLQALWISFTLAAALAAVTAVKREGLGIFALIGLLVWVFGFSLEVTADAQKSRFRTHPENRDRFISTGLWAWSRHPNYFGEIVLWIGVAVIALPVLRGWQWVTLISPLFVAFLLNRISGVPILEKRADEKWGGQADYEAYKKRTPVLIPRSPKVK